MDTRPGRPALRVVHCSCDTAGANALGAMLASEGCTTVHCRGHEALLDELVRRPADGIVIGFAPPCSTEPALLRMVRRLHPDTPLIIVARDMSLEMERMLREYRPLFVAVPPWERSELRGVVRALRAHQARKATEAQKQR